MCVLHWCSYRTGSCEMVFLFIWPLIFYTDHHSKQYGISAGECNGDPYQSVPHIFFQGGRQIQTE